MKRVPSHFGGTRNGMIVSWPAKITDKGGLRSQFHHVIDVAPTIYSAAHVTAPKEVDGIKQVPLAGIDMGYTFANSQAKGKRTTQYFETGGHRAIFKDGWVAASLHGVPWALTGSIGFTNNVWNLYNVDEDFSESEDLAAKNPQKLEELKRVFDAEAKKYSVYPLDDRFVERGANPNRPTVTRGRTSFSYTEGTTRIPEGSAPPVYQRSHRITANLVIPEGGVDGVITATGGSSGGYALFVQDGKLHYEYNFFNRIRYRVTASQPLPAGKVKVELDYEQLPHQPFKETKGGQARLYINGNLVGEGSIANVNMGFKGTGRFSATETFDVGMDLGSPVVESYREKAPFKFTGKIVDIRYDVR